MSFEAIKWAMAQTLTCTEKMVLVVLADFHNSRSGRCNPSIEAIAIKAGMQPRSANRVIRRIQDRGLIDVTCSSGWRSNQYILNTLTQGQGNTLTDGHGSELDNPDPECKNPDPECKNPDPESPKPVRTSKEPHSDAPSVTGAGKPAPCPHSEIIKTYHKILPMLPSVRVVTDTRKRLLRTRWNEDPERHSLDWWAKFFGYVAESDFLTGRAEGTGDRPPFTADFEWLIRPSNFVKVIEGKYHRRGAA